MAAIFKMIFLNAFSYKNVWISIEIPLKFVPKDPISIIPALVQIMAWRRPGDKPLSVSMVLNSLTYMHHLVSMSEYFSGSVTISNYTESHDCLLNMGIQGYLYELK